jgi:hypothetical protein
MLVQLVVRAFCATHPVATFTVRQLSLDGDLYAGGEVELRDPARLFPHLAGIHGLVPVPGKADLVAAR